MNQPSPLEQLESALLELGPGTVLGGILLLIASLHLPVLNYPLVYDDGWVLITNGFLRQPDWSLLLGSEGSKLHVPDVFRPTSVVAAAPMP